MSIQNTKDDSFEEKIPDEDTFAEIGDDSSSSSNRLTKLTRKPINFIARLIQKKQIQNNQKSLKSSISDVEKNCVISSFKFNEFIPALESIIASYCPFFNLLILVSTLPLINL